MNTQNKAQLLDKREELSRRQRNLCEYCMEHIDSLMDLSADEVSLRAEVGKATLFRMIHALGFQSLLEFKMAVHQYQTQQTRPTYWQLQETFSNPGIAVSPLVAGVHANLNALTAIQSEEFRQSFDQAVAALLEGTHIGIFGCRTSGLLAQYMEASLLPLPLEVVTLSQGELFSFDRIYKLPPGSTVFVIGRFPYARLTVQGMELARKLGHCIVCLTDQAEGQLTKLADIALITPRTEGFYSILPFAAVIEGLVTALGSDSSQNIMDRLDALNQAHQEYELMDWL